MANLKFLRKDGMVEYDYGYDGDLNAVLGDGHWSNARLPVEGDVVRSPASKIKFLEGSTIPYRDWDTLIFENGKWNKVEK